MGSTIHDVAAHAQVSISTVSRVLNKTAGVSAAKRQRVEAAVAALSYSPNPAARSLLGQSTGGLGVLLPYITGEFFSELLDGLDEAARAHGFFLLVSSSHRDDAAFARALREISRRVDGLILMSTDLHPSQYADLLPKKTPVVFINTPLLDDAQEHALAGHALDVVRFDNYGGAFAVTEHLIAQGYQRLAVVRGPERAYDADERVRGIHEALRQHGRDPADVPIYAGDFSQEAGYQAAQAIAQRNPLPDAIIASNDMCAIGVLLGLREAGLSVPDQVAVAGFDDVSSAQYASPPLTTVRIRLREVGAWAIERLVQRVQGKQFLAPQRVTMPVDLVLRASTGAHEGTSLRPIAPPARTGR